MHVFAFDRFIFDPADGRLSIRSGSAEAHLRPQVGKLLGALLEDPNCVIDRDTLVRRIWGENAVVDFESGLAALLRELRQSLQSLGGDPALIETVPRRGYRLRAAVERIHEFDRKVELSTVADEGNRWKSKAVIAIAMLLAAVLAVTAWWRNEPSPVAGTKRIHQLAILPLERFGDPDYPPARAGILLADGLLAALWRAELDNVELIGRAGMRPYSGRDDVVSAVAADLDVNLLIEGSVNVDSDSWRVEIRLMEVPPGRVVWSHALAGRATALPAGDVAAELVDALAVAWPDIRKQLD